MSSIGLKVLLKIARSEDPLAFAKCKLTDELFIEPELGVWQFFQSHIEQYGAVPSEDTLLSKGIVDLPTPEPIQYYLDLLVERFTHKKLGFLVHNVKDALNAKELDGAQSIIQDTVSSLTMMEVHHKLLDLSKDAEVGYQKLWMQKNDGKQHGVKLGWPSLDDQAGELVSGDIVSIIGRPGMGKSWLMLYSALNIWRYQKKNVLFVSMEMPEESVLCRLIAMYAKLDAGHVKAATLDMFEQKALQAALNEMAQEPARFWVLDANLSGTVTDIFSMVHHLKPSVVFIDGAYLLRSSNPRLGRYERVADNVELLKRLAHSAGIPGVTSWQFNREAAKKEGDGKQVGLEDIGYSDAIPQISSIALGLFKDSPNNPESLCTRTVTVMKGRDGQTGAFKVHWRFRTHEIGFSELDEEAVENTYDLENV